MKVIMPKQAKDIRPTKLITKTSGGARAREI